VKLVEEVKDNGGTIKIFSSLHISGERECDWQWEKFVHRERVELNTQSSHKHTVGYFQASNAMCMIRVVGVLITLEQYCSDF